MSDQELLDYSGEHVAYEVNMLRQTAQRLREPNIDPVLRNALIESCGIHLRTLIYFLYHEEPRANDIVAADFFDDPAEWEQVRPLPSASLRTARDRASTELAHFTTKRKGPGDREKAWAFPSLIGDLLNTLQAFGENASNAKLHQKVQQALR